MSHKLCYISRISKCVGGIFVSADGSYMTIPDQYLNSAKLQSDSTLLRLCYSSCIVDISGYHLESIYNDAAIGKLGTVIVHNHADTEPGIVLNSPYVTSIIYVNMSPIAASDLENNDA